MAAFLKRVVQESKMANQNNQDSNQRRQQGGGDRSSQSDRQQQQENRQGQMGERNKDKGDQGGKQQR